MRPAARPRTLRTRRGSGRAPVSLDARRTHREPVTPKLPRMSSSKRLGVLLIALALAGCSEHGAERAPGPAGATAGPPLQPVTAAEILARVRTPGARATMVNVWATWCAPCREE